MPETTLTWRHLSADDVPAWTELTNLLAEADGTGEFYEAEDLAEELSQHAFTPELDSWAVWDGDQMVAYGQLRVAETLDDEGRVRCQHDGGVRPSHRGLGIGRELLDRVQARAGSLAAQRHPGAQAFLRSSGGLPGASVRDLLRHRGYEIVRYFLEMGRPLPGDPIVVPQTSVELRSPDEGDERAVWIAHNAAFADHWGTSPITQSRWRDVWTARSNRHSVSTLAVDASGQVVAYVLVGQWVSREAYVNLVGTVPSGRGQGLALACLLRTVELLANSGEYDVVELDVDSDSPTGATRLYERAGFSVQKTFATMQRDLLAP